MNSLLDKINTSDGFGDFVLVLLLGDFLLYLLSSSGKFDVSIHVFTSLELDISLLSSGDFVLDKLSTSDGFDAFVVVFISCEEEVISLLLVDDFLLYLLSSSGKFGDSILVFTLREFDISLLSSGCGLFVSLHCRLSELRYYFQVSSH